MSSAIGLSVDEIDTPALIIDMKKLELNIKDMAEFAKSRNVNLRPHIKTHKSPDIARMQINHGASGIACAKMGEAQVMATHNLRNIHVVYPLASRKKVERIINLKDSAKIIGLIDCYEQARRLSKVLSEHDMILDVTVTIDVGLNREGIQLGDAVEFFQKVSTLPNVNVIGISTHAGHVYSAGSRDDVIKIGKEEGETMVKVAEGWFRHRSCQCWLNPHSQNFGQH